LGIIIINLVIGNFRNRLIGGTYLFFKGKISGNIPRKYGQKYGTNVPPFYDPGMTID
jgi:hypothetical protein